MIRFWSRAYVSHLEAEIEWLRQEKNKETFRANVAVAELVRLKTDGLANVHPRPMMPDTDPAQDVLQQLSELQSNAEFAGVGT